MKEIYEEEGESGTNLGRVLRDDLSTEMRLIQSLKGKERASHQGVKERFQARLNSMCKELRILSKLK